MSETGCANWQNGFKSGVLGLVSEGVAENGYGLVPGGCVIN